MTTRIIYFSAIFLSLMLPSALCWGQQTDVAPPLAQPRVVVFRFHANLFEQSIERQIQREVPVRTCILDAWCVGTARASGLVALDFAGGTESRIPLKLEGRIDARANGYVGPVVATSRSSIAFEADLAIGFDGTKFRVLPGRAKARPRTTIECVRTRRNGLGSRLVNRIASRIAPKQLSPYDAAASDLTQREILNAASETMQPIVAQLNDLVSLEQTLVAFGIPGYERKVSKASRFLQVRVSPQGESTPVPPKTEMAADVPVEIWIYPNKDRPLLANVVMTWQRVPEGIRRMLPPAPEPVQKLDDQVRIAAVGDWDVIRVGRLSERKD